MKIRLNQGLLCTGLMLGLFLVFSSPMAYGQTPVKEEPKQAPKKPAVPGTKGKKEQKSGSSAAPKGQTNSQKGKGDASKDKPATATGKPTVIKGIVVSPKKVAKGDKLTISGIPLKESVETVEIGEPLENEKGEKVRNLVNFIVVKSPKNVKGKTIEVEIPDLDEKVGKKVEKIDVEVVVAGKSLKHEIEYYDTRISSVIQHRLVYFSLIFYVVFLAGIFGNLKSSPIVSKTGKFSLSKMQMSLWTLTFGTAYVFLASFWGEFLDITEGMFILMGISAATAAGAKAIVVKNIEVPVEAQMESWNAVENLREDGYKGTIESVGNVVNLTKDLKDPNAKLLQTEYATVNAQFQTNDADRNVHKKIERLVPKATLVAPPPSTLFCDWNQQKQDYTASLHRCQIAMWTVVVWIVYVIALLGTMRFPDIPKNLLFLMGISSGTYLGFNFPKKT